MAEYTLNGQEWLNAFKAQLHNAIEQIADEGLVRLRNEVSIPYPPASEPNNPPHLRTGELRDGLSAEVNGNSITFSSAAAYSDDLEFGMVKMAPRPFMRPHQMFMRERFIPELIKQIGKA